MKNKVVTKKEENDSLKKIKKFLNKFWFIVWKDDSFK